MIGQRVSLGEGREGLHAWDEQFPLHPNRRAIIIARARENSGEETIYRLPVPMNEQGEPNMGGLELIDRSYMSSKESNPAYNLLDQLLQGVGL